MSTPQFEIDILNDLLGSENIDLLQGTAAFHLARCIAEYQDVDLLANVPSWLSEMVWNMCDDFRANGRYVLVSNVGEADHSEMMAKLMALLSTTRK